MAAVENDCPLTGDITDRASNTVNKNAPNNRDTGKVYDRFYIYRRLLTCKSKKAPCSVAG